MKKRELIGMTLVGGAAFLATGWSFFDMLVNYSKRKKESKRQWFQLSHIKVNHPRNGYEQEYEEGKAWCMAQPMKHHYIRSDDGLKLHAYYLPAKNAKRYVILCHGYKGSGFGDFANTARFLHEHGCHLLIIDERCCGKSEGRYITFGAKEHLDIVRWAEHLAGHSKKRLPIYLYGVSMGAASVLLASGEKLPRTVRGLISDCGFSSMKEQIREMAADWFHLHWIGLLILRVDILCRLVAGFKMSDADTTAALQQNHLPVLFFHGTDDTYVDPKNSVRNYHRSQGQKELIIVPGARHMCCPYVAEEKYRDKLMEFFEKNDYSRKMRSQLLSKEV